MQVLLLSRLRIGGVGDISGTDKRQGNHLNGKCRKHGILSAHPRGVGEFSLHLSKSQQRDGETHVAVRKII